MILSHDMTGERGAIGKDAIVLQQAVVRDVDPDHQKIPRTDARLFAFAGGSMNGHVFADQVFVADDQAAGFASELNVLRFAAEGGVLVNAIAGADGGEALDDRMRPDLAPRTDRYFILDDDVRTDLRISCNLGPRINYGRWMNSHSGSVGRVKAMANGNGWEELR